MPVTTMPSVLQRRLRYGLAAIKRRRKDYEENGADWSAERTQRHRAAVMAEYRAMSTAYAEAHVAHADAKRQSSVGANENTPPAS